MKAMSKHTVRADTYILTRALESTTLLGGPQQRPSKLLHRQVLLDAFSQHNRQPRSRDANAHVSQAPSQICPLGSTVPQIETSSNTWAGTREGVLIGVPS